MGGLMYKIVVFTVTKGRTSCFVFFPWILILSTNLNASALMSISTLLPTEWRHRIMRRAQVSHLRTWLKKMKIVSFNNTLGESRHSCFRCHAPNISDRRRCQVIRWMKRWGSFFLLVKLVKKRIKTKGRGGYWPSSSICVPIMNENLFLVELLVSWSPLSLLCPLSERAAHDCKRAIIISTKVGAAPKTSPQRRRSRPLFAFQLGRLLHSSVFVEQLQHLLFVVEHFHHGVSGLRHLVHNQLATLHVTLKTYARNIFLKMLTEALQGSKISARDRELKSNTNVQTLETQRGIHSSSTKTLANGNVTWMSSLIRWRSSSDPALFLGIRPSWRVDSRLYTSCSKLV